MARTIDSDRKHLTSVLSAAAAHRGTSLVEIYQNCPIFNDGAFDAIKDRDTKADAIIPLVHGEPIRFGVGTARKGADPRQRDRRRQGRRGRRRRRGRAAGPRRAQPGPDDGVRDLAAHRRGLPPPVADRDLPAGRAADVRRPGARPGRHRRRAASTDDPADAARRADRRRRHLDGRSESPLSSRSSQTARVGRRRTCREARTRTRHQSEPFAGAEMRERNQPWRRARSRPACRLPVAALAALALQPARSPR